MARFTLPRDLYHGKGSLEALKDVYKRQPELRASAELVAAMASLSRESFS